MERTDVSDRSRAIALALCATIGVFGGHRYYVGKVGTGLLMFCTIGGMGIWWLYDMITVCAGSFRDAQGNRVVSWSELDPRAKRDKPEDARLDVVLEEVDVCRAEVAELAERVDFMERILARVRERDAIPPGR